MLLYDPCHYFILFCSLSSMFFLWFLVWQLVNGCSCSFIIAYVVSTRYSQLLMLTKAPGWKKHPTRCSTPRRYSLLKSTDRNPHFTNEGATTEAAEHARHPPADILILEAHLIPSCRLHGWEWVCCMSCTRVSGKPAETPQANRKAVFPLCGSD